MKTFRVVVCSLAMAGLFPGAALAADATGVWRGDVKLPDGQTLPFIARLTQSAAKITGKLDGIGGAPDVEVVNGKVEKEVITFSGVRQINNAPVKFNYTARFKDDNTLEFTIVRDDGSAAPLMSMTRRAKD